MSDDWYPKDKDELMFAIDRERTALLNLASSLSDDQMSTPDSSGWAPKDNIAHVTEWIKSFIGYHLDHRPWHEVLRVDQRLTDAEDFDGINDLIFQRKRKLPAWDVITEFRDVCMELYSRLNALSFEDLMQPRFPDDPEKRPLMRWVLANTTEHFAEHRAYIERAVKANHS
ncbi:MAG: ClbS/DfsB family four-helix bundle protein [Chloroflexi bacterium]|nr:ClbS/DfsB family four-helix bundle protein [Chloroflexota bacterium]